MFIEIRLFMKFKQYLPVHSPEGKTVLSLGEDTTVAGLLEKLGIPPDEPKLLIINGKSRGAPETVNSEQLHDGNVVAIFSPAAGG